MASAGEDRSLRVWDLRRGEEIAKYFSAENPVTCVVFSENEKLVFFGSDDTNIYVGDIETGETSGTFKGHEEPVRSLTVGLADQNLFSGDQKGNII